MNNDKNYFVYPIQNISIKTGDKVAIIDGDGSNGVDNLALMKLSAYEKRRGVKTVALIKLKHQRVKGKLIIHPDSAEELKEVADYDRVYASFIFTRSKPIVKQLAEMFPKAFIGGTGVDEYFEKQPSDLRAQPKSVTQLPPTIEEMYPDFALYDNPEADQNIAFWRDPLADKLPKKARAAIERSPTKYGIPPEDLLSPFGGAEHAAIKSKTCEWFDRCARENGLTDGALWRGSTRGSGYSSKGCHRKCTFCVVPVIQGHINPMHYGLLGVINWVLPISFYPTMTEIVELYRAGKLSMRPHIFRDAKGTVKRASPFLTISDNNFPADPTCIEKMQYMIENGIAVNLNQGMDARLLTAKKRIDKDGTEHPSGDEICEKLARLHFINFEGTARQIHFSWDFLSVEKAVMAGVNKLVNEYGMNYRNFTVYCLSGFNTTFEEDYVRVMKLRRLRIDPFIMLFRNVDGSEGLKEDNTTQDWRLRHLTRWTNNKILFRATEFDAYEPYAKELHERREEGYINQKECQQQLDLFDWLTETYVKHA